MGRPADLSSWSTLRAMSSRTTRAASAVAPGGILLIEGHMDDPHHPHDDLVLQTPAEVVAALELGEGWEVLLAEEHPREHNGRQRTDSTVKLRRA